MTTETLTLSQFLLERIAEWEKVAGRAGSFTPWDEDFQNDNYGHLTVQPSVILATCKAHRAIVELHTSSDRDGFYSHKGVMLDTCDVCVNFHADMDCSNEPWPCPTLRALASTYADHPAFDSRWAL